MRNTPGGFSHVVSLPRKPRLLCEACCGAPGGVLKPGLSAYPRYGCGTLRAFDCSPARLIVPYSSVSSAILSRNPGAYVLASNEGSLFFEARTASATREPISIKVTR